MKLAHTVTLSVFVKKEDDEEKCKKALLSLIPFINLEKDKIKLSRIVTEGFENKIIILELTLQKEKHTFEFIEQLKKKISSADLNLLATQENRVDDECMFYARFDKKALLQENKLVLTDSGDCFHMKMSVAAFPKKREAALLVVKKIFN
jgi:RNA binding exosome subunit